MELQSPPTVARGRRSDKTSFQKISPEKARIFVVDDDVEIQTLLHELFRSENYTVEMFSTATAFLDKLAAQPAGAAAPCELLICDLKLPDIDGLELIERVRSLNLDIPVILITAHATVETAAAALKSGAFDYITKPINFTELSVIAGRAIKLRQLEKDHRLLQEKLEQAWSLGDMVGRSPKMQHIFDLIERVSCSPSNVLITGESGSGKEMIARAIHSRSDRSEGPFVAINCSAIPDALLESELFGHRKGSFTGANEERRGLFEEAKGGTVFLDEIGDMPMALQAKLLRVIQERKVKPVGENKLREIDVRIIAATHKDLKKAVQDGSFREDLYYRLCVFPIAAPPLRERKEDIPLLAGHFLEKFCRINKVPEKSFTKNAVSKLLRLHWGGNVRELENTIERSVLLSDSANVDECDIQLDSPSAASRSVESLFSGLMTLPELEKEYIQYVLAETSFEKEEAAEILGINRKTLYRKEREYGIS